MLLGHLGARLSEPVPATGATMAGLSGSATWASTTPVQAVNPPAGSAIGTATAQAQSEEGPLPISVRWAYGKGQVLGLGVDPMGWGRTGYELLPTLSRLVGEATMAPAGPSRNGLELYLDPGVLPPNIERNVNAVAALAQGARVVDVAGVGHQLHRSLPATIRTPPSSRPCMPGASWPTPGWSRRSWIWPCGRTSRNAGRRPRRARMLTRIGATSSPWRHRRASTWPGNSGLR